MSKTKKVQFLNVAKAWERDFKVDSQKVIQVLKQIFDMYGGEIARKQSSFKAAVFDLLPGQEYKDERIVLRNAIEADAILPLAASSPITEEAVVAAKKQLRKSAYMTDEGAEFVIRCVAAALGGNQETTTQKTDRHGEKEERSRLKSVAMLVIFGILIWGASFLIFYLADEMDIRAMPFCSIIISICAVLWLKKHMDSNVFAAVVLSIVWGAVGFLLFFFSLDGVYSIYHNDNFYDSYQEYLRGQVPVEAYDDINKWKEDFDKVISDIEDNNGLFYYNGHQYGLSYEEEQILTCVTAVITIILIHFIQKIVLNAASRLRKRSKSLARKTR